MAWVLVIVAGALEVGFAVALKASDGFSRLVPSVVFVVCAALSFTLLNLALRELPIGTAYAVWTGIGAAGTALVGMVFLGDPVTALRIGSIALIVVAVVGLQLAGGGH
jgi:quaternary ammonium compound-resistance protein SugE